MIPAGFAILTGLLLWAVIGSKGAWAPKLLLILLLPVFVWRVNAALNDYRGYPVQANPPSGSRLLAHAVDEADQRIYVWVLVNEKPRAYELPYSREQHEALEGAKQLQAQGKPVGLRTVRTEGTRIPKNLFRPYTLPPPHLPEK